MGNNVIEETSLKLIEELSYCDECKSNEVQLELVDVFISNCRNLLTLDFVNPNFKKEDIDSLLISIKNTLMLISRQAKVKDYDALSDIFITKLPGIRRLIGSTIEAILDGDPASDSSEEIVKSYPGFLAILHYRVANELYKLGLKNIARYISEIAHQKTGIDINPGATIGSHFFIDHGTGIVIGETAVVGNNVKLYQGVTLGAISLSKGKMLKGSKRHPTVEDDVTIYSNASILGGNTIIGKGSTIGANVYLTDSIPPNSRVYLSESGIKFEIKK